MSAGMPTSWWADHYVTELLDDGDAVASVPLDELADGDIAVVVAHLESRGWVMGETIVEPNGDSEVWLTFHGVHESMTQAGQ